MRHYKAAILLVMLFLSFGCSHFDSYSPRARPEKAKTVISMQLPFNPGKGVWSSYENTFYFADFEANEVHIYQEDRRVNRVGGLGLRDDNFNRLNDISVSGNGKLLALDGLLKQIKQFDENGKLMDIHSLKFTQQPVLFDLSPSGVVYVYDALLDEILIIDENLEEVIHRFGKFFFRSPQLLVSNRNNVTVYDKGFDKTFIFDNFGDLKTELPGFWQTDRHGNRYQLQTGNIIFSQNDDKVVLNESFVGNFTVKGNHTLYRDNRQVTFARIVYRQRDQRKDEYTQE